MFLLAHQVNETVDVVFVIKSLGKVRSQKRFVFWFIMTLNILFFIDSNRFVANQTSRSVTFSVRIVKL